MKEKNNNFKSSIEFNSENKQEKSLINKQKEGLSGIKKAAILLISVGENVSSEILKHLSEEEIQTLAEEIAKIDKVEPDLKKKILREFKELTDNVDLIHASKGGKDTAIEILSKTYGKDKAIEIVSRAEKNHQRPLQKMNEVDSKKITSVLKNEHPQTIAIVLAYLEAKKSAEILSMLPSYLKPDIVKRIALLKKANTEIIESLEQSIAEKIRALPDEGEKVGGIQTIIDILNSGMGEELGKKILEDLEDTDGELAHEIKRRLIKYDDILLLLDKDVQKILSKVSYETIAKVLKISNEEIRQKIISNLSKRVYQEEIEPILHSGPMRLLDIEEAKSEIINIMRDLINSGEIFFSDEYI